MQRDSVGLTTQNNELKFRLQAMEQQAQLRDGTHFFSYFVSSIALIDINISLCASVDTFNFGGN